MPYFFCSRVIVRVMQTQFALFALVGIARHGSAAEMPAAVTVFAPGKLWQVHITLSADEYATIEPRRVGGIPGFDPQPMPPETPMRQNREVHRNNFNTDLAWGTGAIVIGDHHFPKVGIRYKGNGTIFDTTRSIKKSFKIDLDRAGGESRFGGSRTINLHCGVTDPTKLRESLAYGICRAAGLPAPRTALAEVSLSVPGKYDKELLGLYTICEDVDKPFLKDRFGEDKGLLMKPEGLRDFNYLGDDWAKYKTSYAPKREARPEESKRMIGLAKLIAQADDTTFRKEVGSYLDVDNYLQFLATTTFLSNTDSFFGLGHNYYMYLDPKKNKLHFIPWDVDRSFANFGNADQNMDLSLTHPYAGTHKLTERLLAAPDTSASYQKVFKDLATTTFSRDGFLKELATLEKVAREPRERDARAATNRREGEGGFGPPGGMFGKAPELETFINKRTESVKAQLDGKSKGYIPQPFGGPGGFRPPGNRR